ncbi:MAG: dihydropteroate synthase [Bradymonadaceae bacterium]
MPSFYGQPRARPTPPPIEFEESRLTFDRGTAVMGVVNVTPDSFSDGGDYFGHEDATDRAARLERQGADLIDIGGESTRPGASAVPVDEEIDRVVPVVERTASRLDVPISIDTRKAEVARRALEAGADLVNDVSALRYDPQMAEVVADSGAPVVLMHMLDDPKTMQQSIEYDDVVDDIAAFFEDRVGAAVSAGVDEDQIVLDPGIGFGKTVDQNYRLVRELSAFFELDCPLLLGTSRKSFLGAILDKPPKARIWGTAASVACGVYAGADIVRVHDVEEMVDVVRIADAVGGSESAH